jgi:protein required for attachment to host cells
MSSQEGSIGTATAFRPDVCSTRSRSLSSTNFVSSGASKEDDETANTGTTSQRNGFANEIAKALYHHARANLFEKLAIIAPTAKDPALRKFYQAVRERYLGAIIPSKWQREVKLS